MQHPFFLNFESRKENEQLILRINKGEQKDTTINSNDDDVRCDGTWLLFSFFFSSVHGLPIKL